MKYAILYIAILVSACATSVEKEEQQIQEQAQQELKNGF